MCFIILVKSDKVKQMIKNKPFLGYLVPLFRNKSSYKTSRRFHTETCIDTEAQGNSEMAHLVYAWLCVYPFYKMPEVKDKPVAIFR